MILSASLVIAVGYLLGSISTGILLSKFFAKTDIRNQGSGNAGTTNMLRILGRRLAFFTFIGDMIKGIIAVYIGRVIVGGELGGMLGVLGAVFGHFYPLYFKFKGGKGVATSFGSILFVYPIQTLIALAVFLVLVAFTHYVSLGSVAAAFVLPILLIITHPDNIPVCLIGVVIGSSIIWRHRANIRRLLNRTESRLDFNTLKKKK